MPPPSSQQNTAVDADSDADAGNELVGWLEATEYTTLRRNNCSTIRAQHSHDPTDFKRILLEDVDRLNARSITDVQAGAAAGSPDDMLELALRHTSGVTTRQDYVAALFILTTLTSNTTTPRRIRACAFSVLAHIHYDVRTEGDSEGCNIDSVYRAAQAADAAAALGFVTPDVMFIGMWIEQIGFRRQSDCKWPGHSTARFERLMDLWRVVDQRYAEVAEERAVRAEKVNRAPNAYVCAAAGCGIEATHKSSLLKCAGKCKQEGKPSYCSKDCQRKDWKRHKPFCKDGAPLDEVAARQKPHISVPEDTPVNTASSDPADGPLAETGIVSAGNIWQHNPKREHAIEIPHPFLPGQTTKVASKTMDPTFLKEFRTAINKRMDS